MNGQMTAAVLYGKEDVKIERVPIPELEKGEVLIRVQAALTCGTDLKVYRRGYHAKMIVPPALFGHEFAGVIEEIGPGVKNFKAGQRVVALNSAPCGQCFYCKKHQENLCEDLLFNNGAYAEFIRIPRRIVENNMLVVPKEISFETAALTEPLACVLRGSARNRSGDRRNGHGDRSRTHRADVHAGGPHHGLRRDCRGEARRAGCSRRNTPEPARLCSSPRSPIRLRRCAI